jgi:hypothetical protein
MCVAVELHGALSPLDELDLSAITPAHVYKGTSSGNIELPLLFAALLPASLNGTLVLEVAGRRGTTVALGQATLAVPPSGQRVRIDLVSSAPDGGADLAIPEGSTDLAARDLAASDLLVPDLSRCFDGGVACNNACVDFTSDPHNCGACGHDCLGGSCTASMCQPTFLVTNPKFPGGIALDSDNLYWGDGNGINQVPLGGGAHSPLGNLSHAWGLALLGGMIYATDFQLSVWGVPVSGGSAVKIADSPSGLVMALAADASNVYFTTWSNGAGGTSGVIEQAPIGGGGPTLSLGSIDYGRSQRAPVSPWPFNVSVQGDHVYWTNPGSGDASGAVMRALIGGGTPEAIASPQLYPWAIATDATYVYWTNLGTEGNNFTDGAVMKMPLAGGTATFVVASLTAPNTIALDATQIYFSSNSTSVSRVPITGGNPTPLGSVNGVSPVHLAVDATSVYWSGSAIVKVAK